MDNPTLEDLISREMLSEEEGEFLKLLVKSEVSFIIIGQSGSGKTTLLNCLNNNCIRPLDVTQDEIRCAVDVAAAVQSVKAGLPVWTTMHQHDMEALKALISQASAHSVFHETFPIFVETAVYCDHSRKVAGIFEVTGTEGFAANKHCLYCFDLDKVDTDGKGNHLQVHGRHSRVGALSDELAQKIYEKCQCLQDVQKFARAGWLPKPQHKRGE